MYTKLLDDVFNQSKETCLSELKIPNKLNEILDMINHIPDEKYSLECWEYLISYITDKKIKVKTVSDAKDYITKWVKENKRLQM